MSSSHASIVVTHSHKVITTWSMVVIDHPFLHVQTFSWVLDECVKFVPPVAVVREAFEVDNKHTRKLPKIKLLCCTLMFLTLGTIPDNKIENINADSQFQRNLLLSESTHKNRNGYDIGLILPWILFSQFLCCSKHVEAFSELDGLFLGWSSISLIHRIINF